MDAVAEGMLPSEAQRAVTRRDELLPLLLSCWAWSLVGECVASEVEENQSCANVRDRVHKVQERQAVRVLVMRACPAKRGVHAKTALRAAQTRVNQCSAPLG